jgi:hypothetical protein
MFIIYNLHQAGLLFRWWDQAVGMAVARNDFLENYMQKLWKGNQKEKIKT